MDLNKKKEENQDHQSSDYDKKTQVSWEELAAEWREIVEMYELLKDAVRDVVDLAAEILELEFHRRTHGFWGMICGR